MESMFTYTEKTTLLSKWGYNVVAVPCKVFHNKEAVGWATLAFPADNIPLKIANSKEYYFNDLMSEFNVETVFRHVLKKRILEIL